MTYSVRNKEEAYGLLNRVWTANKFYKDEDTSEEDKGRILRALEKTFCELEVLGIDRGFTTLLTLYGQWFLRAEFKVDNLEDFMASYVK